MDINQILDQITYLNTYRKIDDYRPYEYQQKLHHGKDSAGQLAKIRAILAANQIGKSTAGAMEVAFHLTGQYPDWWDGLRFTKPVVIMCGSKTNDLTRDVVQQELFGDPGDPEKFGTAAIPKDAIANTSRKAGVVNALDSASIHHVSGGRSKIMFRAYEQGKEKHMGHRIDFGWMDEEPPYDIYSQYERGTISTNGSLLLTFTPENGVTEVVDMFMNNLPEGCFFMNAGWSDAPHLTPEIQAQKLARMQPYEREMRSKGIPVFGSGLIFDIPDEDIMCDPFEIPAHYRKIIGIDFGWDHPAAIVSIAIDDQTKTAYIYHTFKRSKVVTPVMIDILLNSGAADIPVMWPHDGMQAERNSGQPISDVYRDKGVNMHRRCFTNPPSKGNKEGSGGQAVEPGIEAMYTAFIEGRLKVFSNQQDWFEEKRFYHRKSDATGSSKIVKLKDDLMAATRYAYQSLRFATNNMPIKSNVSNIKGVSNWG